MTFTSLDDVDDVDDDDDVTTTTTSSAENDVASTTSSSGSVLDDRNVTATLRAPLHVTVPIAVFAHEDEDNEGASDDRPTQEGHQ